MRAKFGAVSIKQKCGQTGLQVWRIEDLLGINGIYISTHQHLFIGELADRTKTFTV